MGMAKNHFHRNSSAQATFPLLTKNSWLSVRTGRDGLKRGGRAGGVWHLCCVRSICMPPKHSFFCAINTLFFFSLRLVLFAKGRCRAEALGRDADQRHVFMRTTKDVPSNSAASRFHLLSVQQRNGVGRESIDWERARGSSARLEDVRPVCFVLGPHLCRSMFAGRSECSSTCFFDGPPIFPMSAGRFGCSGHLVFHFSMSSGPV